MKVEDLDGNQHTISLGSYVLIDTKRARSKLHLLARHLIKQQYQTITITEEVPVKIRRGKTLYLDFYIPLLHTAIEVHGEQHYKFNSLYHSSSSDFLLQKKNDCDKQEWCDLNNITLITLPHFESVEQWQNRLLMKE